MRLVLADMWRDISSAFRDFARDTADAFRGMARDVRGFWR